MLVCPKSLLFQRIQVGFCDLSGCNLVWDSPARFAPLPDAHFHPHWQSTSAPPLVKLQPRLQSAKLGSHWAHASERFSECQPLGNVKMTNEKPNWWCRETSSALATTPWRDIMCCLKKISFPVKVWKLFFCKERVKRNRAHISACRAKPTN